MERKARTTPAQLHGLENKKKSGQRRGIFLDFPFYRTYQNLGESRIAAHSGLEKIQLVDCDPISALRFVTASRVELDLRDDRLRPVCCRAKGIEEISGAHDFMVDAN